LKFIWLCKGRKRRAAAQHKKNLRKRETKLDEERRNKAPKGIE
jgi:hypothetical protein